MGGKGDILLRRYLHTQRLHQGWESGVGMPCLTSDRQTKNRRAWIMDGGKLKGRSTAVRGGVERIWRVFEQTTCACRMRERTATEAFSFPFFLSFFLFIYFLVPLFERKYMLRESGSSWGRRMRRTVKGQTGRIEYAFKWTLICQSSMESEYKVRNMTKKLPAQLMPQSETR